MSESALWRFSLAFYRRPGVADACLQLQDTAGVDVNVMLYLIFLATRGRRVGAQSIERIEAVAAEWRSAVIVPLREIRRRLKGPIGVFEVTVTADLRNDVKRIELRAERLEQEALERLCPLDTAQPDAGAALDIARANMAAYASRLGALPAEPLESVLQALARFRT